MSGERPSRFQVGRPLDSRVRGNAGGLFRDCLDGGPGLLRGRSRSGDWPVFQERGTAHDGQDADQRFPAVGVGEAQFFAGGEVDGLRLALVDRDVGGVEIGSVAGVALGVEAAFERGQVSDRFGEDDAAAFRQGRQVERERGPAGRPFALKARRVPGGGGKHGHWKVGRV